MQGNNGGSPLLIGKPSIPMWGGLLLLVSALSAYFGQKEATTSALVEIKTEMKAMKSTMDRMETDRYTGADARRDFAWRDERAAEISKRLADVEQDARTRRR